MSTAAAIVATIMGAVIFFNLTKNVGTSTKPVTALGEVTGATTTVVGSLTK